MVVERENKITAHDKNHSERHGDREYGT